MAGARINAPKTLAKLIMSNHSGPFPHAKGLVIVCGETGSRKSTVADGLLRELVGGRLKDGGHNHVIALGNPVDWKPYQADDHEKPSGEVWDGDVRTLASTYGFRYTPRTLGLDTTLPEALMDALRQKPAAVYVDEIRAEDDWEPLLRFAQTGHLLVTTAHAGSIRDLLLWLFRCLGVVRRSQAPSVARNILAVVHTEVKNGITAPELWLGDRGAAPLAAYGPGALVPDHSLSAALIAREYLFSTL
jgi:hypothetical protein